MFTIKKSKNKGMRVNSNTSIDSKTNESIGVDSKRLKKSNKDDFTSESYQMPTSLGPGANLSSNPVTIDMEPLLVGLTPQVESAFYRLYRDIYYFDSVAGSAVDLISQVTFSSEFNIGGISDIKIRNVYDEALERLNVRTLLPEMSTDHLVLGTHCSSLLYNKTKRVFADLMCHPIESLTITDIPFYSQDPIINVKFSDQVKASVSSSSPSLNYLKELVGETILEKISTGSLDLDPLTTIYIPRKTFSYTELGTSYFKRILPIYLIEKNLYRGTLVESARRQRGILHLTLGDGDEWIPQLADMEFMTDLFMCLTGDTLLHTTQGLKRIDSICSRKGLEKDTGININLRLKGADGKMCNATKWWYRGFSNVFKVTSEYGHHIEGTKDHKVFVVSNNGPEWKKIKDLTISDYLCIDTKVLETKNPELKFTVYKHKNDGRSNPVHLPKYMTTDLAYVLGLTLAEGNFSEDGIKIHNTDLNILKKFVRCLASFGIKASYKKGKINGIGSIYSIKGVTGTRKRQGYSAKGYSRIFLKYLKSIGVRSVTSFFKSIPTSILESSLECQRSFIAGMMDGDGSLVGGQYRIYSCSTVMLHQLQVMMSNLGITVCVNRDYPFLNLSVSHSQELADQIDEYLACQTLRLPVSDHFCKKSGVPVKWLIMLLKSRYIRNEHGVGRLFYNDTGEVILIPDINPSYDRLFRGVVCNYNSKDGILLRDSFLNGGYDEIFSCVKLISKEAYNTLITLFKTEYSFFKVRSVIPSGKKHVYDLTISDESVPAFVANGIVVHNSADSDPLGAIIATRSGVQVEEHRCLSGNSVISTSKGLRLLKNIVKHDPESLQPGTSFDTNVLVKNSEGKFAKVDKWWYQGKKPVVTLTTESGYALTGTKEHNLITIKNGKFSLQKFGDIDLGKTWALIERQGNTSSVINKLPVFINTREYRKVTSKFTYPTYMSDELAYVLGLIVSEGYVHHGGIGIVNTDRKILDKYIKCFDKCFNVKPIIRLKSDEYFTEIHGKMYNAKTAWCASIHSSGIVDFLRNLGIKPSKELRTIRSPSYKKQIPKCIMQGSRESQLAFLAAYLDGDGCLGRGRNNLEFNFYSTSKMILRGLHYILINMGYLSKLDYSQIRIVLTAAESQRLMQEINHAVKRRPEIERHMNSNKLGVPAELVTSLLSLRENNRCKKNGIMGTLFENDDGEYVHIPGGWKELFKHFVYQASPDYEDARSYFSYAKAEAGEYERHMELISKVSTSLYKTLRKLFERKPKFERVISIKDSGIEHVYDLTMDASGPPIFVANGILVKNSGGDFWKVNDYADTVMSYKLRALGISEAFLTGDASYNSADASMTIFVEMLRSYRDMMTRKFFYDRVFPLISMVHGYTINAKGKVSIREEVKNVGSLADALKVMNDGSKLLIPSVTWAKSLKPEGDSTYMDLLNTLSEKGVPIPLRVLAAAGGLNLDELLRQKEDDLSLRKHLQDYTKALKQFAPPPPEEGMGEASSIPLSSTSGVSAVLQSSGGHRPPLLSREFDPELKDVTKTGRLKIMSASGQANKNHKINKLIIQALKESDKKMTVKPTSFNTPDKSSF